MILTSALDCGRRYHGPQIIATSLRWASVSPSMYRWVVWIDRWPASSCTSRREPPALCTMRAARVTNVRRPECDEQPFRPMFLNARLNHTTMLTGRIRPPRSEAITYCDGGATWRHAAKAAARSGWSGIDRPLHFLAALSASSIRPLIWPLASSTMSQVRLAISPARNPALAESRTRTLLRSGCRVQLAYTTRSPTFTVDSIFARFPGILGSLL